jgi:hypothetical protein
MAPGAPALTLTCGGQAFPFDDDEKVALAALDFLYGAQGGPLGKLLATRASLTTDEVHALAALVELVRGKLGEPLVVYDHGHGQGTVCFQSRPWYELVKRSGARYLKPTPRYVAGQRGKLEAVVDVVYARGRSVTAKDPGARPQTLGDVPAVRSAVERLSLAIDCARAIGPLSSEPREALEYF